MSEIPIVFVAYSIVTKYLEKRVIVEHMDMCPVYHAVLRLFRRRWQGDQELCLCQQMRLKYVITSQRTGLLGTTRLKQTHKPKSTELGCFVNLDIGRQSIKHSRLIHGYPCVMIGFNPRQFREVLETVDTRSRLQKNPHWQFAPVRDALIMLSPISLPRMSDKTSETGEKTKTKRLNL